MKDRVAEQVGPATEQVQEKAGQAFSQARHQVTARLDTQIDRAAEGLTQAAEAVRQTGQQMHQQDQAGPIAEYADEAAEKIERFATFLRERDTNQILGDTERFARQNPALFLAGAFTLGLAAARFFKSSPPQMSGGHYDYGQEYPRTTPSATFPMQRSVGAPSQSSMNPSPSGSATSPSPGSSAWQSGQSDSGTTPGTPPNYGG